MDNLMEKIASIPFYTKSEPLILDSVVGEVLDFNDDIVYIKMVEYGGMEGVIPANEIGIKRHKRVSDYVKKGGLVVAQVIRIEDNKYDCSLKKSDKSDKEHYLKRFHEEQKIRNILGTASDWNVERVKEMYSICRQNMELLEKERMYEYFESMLVGDIDFLSEELKRAVTVRIPMPSFTKEKTITLRTIDTNGVKKISEILDSIAKLENVKVFVVAPPIYKIQVTGITEKKVDEIYKEIERILLR
jgi:translation initiation factor 2 alpha subunit (eIF-2alpha)